MAPFTGRHGMGDSIFRSAAPRCGAGAGRAELQITINITSPMFRLTATARRRTAGSSARHWASDRKGRETGGQVIAANMSAEQRRAAAQRQARSAKRPRRNSAGRTVRCSSTARADRGMKAERKELPSINYVVLELLPGAVEIEAACGFLFNTRHLVYRIRDEVLRRTGKELTQSYFDELLTEIEAEHGDLHPLLIREARGSFRIPHPRRHHAAWHTDRPAFQRPAWTFNKIVAIEKEDLRLMLEQAGWDERHDA